jgi:hypothetical protein
MEDGMNKQELIDKAVFVFDGSWPSKSNKCIYMEGFTDKNSWCCSNDASKAIFTKDEFQQRARELGYINGYRWGVEYPTNGKGPDLPDDTVVRYWLDETSSGQERVLSLNWQSDPVDCYPIIKFKITDQRYKPADTSYLETPTLEPAPQEEGWYDYDNQKAIALPPVGVECEVYGALGPYNEWQKCRIMAQHRSIVFVCDDNHWTYRKDVDFQFRPLDYNRKAEAEKKRVVEAAAKKFHASIMPDYSGQPFLDGLGALYDAGYLKLPTE